VFNLVASYPIFYRCLQAQLKDFIKPMFCDLAFIITQQGLIIYVNTNLNILLDGINLISIYFILIVI